MSLQQTFTDESFITHPALVRFLAGVKHFVNLERALHRKPLLTVLTRISLLRQMNALMPLQTSTVCKSFPTFPTTERLLSLVQVRECVRPQISNIFETLVTDFTEERPLIRMNSLVFCKSAAMLERCQAFFTFIRPGIRVDNFVRP